MENLNTMAFYTKINNSLKDSNVFVKVPNTQTLKEAKNIWIKNENGTLKPIWNYRWDTGSWSACSSKCGGGTQTRSVTCMRTNNIVKPDVFCSDITKPSTSQTCNTQSCEGICKFNFKPYNSVSSDVVAPPGSTWWRIIDHMYNSGYTSISSTVVWSDDDDSPCEVIHNDFIDNYNDPLTLRVTKNGYIYYVGSLQMNRFGTNGELLLFYE